MFLSSMFSSSCILPLSSCSVQWEAETCALKLYFSLPFVQFSSVARIWGWENVFDTVNQYEGKCFPGIRFFSCFILFFFSRFIIACAAFIITKLSVPHQFHWSTSPSTWDDADFDSGYTLSSLAMEKIHIVKMDIFSAWDTTLHISVPFLYKKVL